jgi:cell division cycle 2-like protein
MSKRSKWEDDSDDDQGDGHSNPASSSPAAFFSSAGAHAVSFANCVTSEANQSVDAHKYPANDFDCLIPLEKARSHVSDSPAVAAQAEAFAQEVSATPAADTMELDLPDDDMDAAVLTPKGKMQLYNCRLVDSAYERLNSISEGAYGVVFRARNLHTREIVALKQIKMLKCMEGFPITTLREVSLLLQLKHENILNVHEVVVSPKGQVFMVSEFVDNDLRALLEKNYRFSQTEVKCLVLQLLSAMACAHTHWILHRDLKTANLLYSNRGLMKVADFGLARLFGEPCDKLTPTVVTLHYRAPELLLSGDSKPLKYGPEIDMWSVGCIMAELLLGRVLMRATSELEQINCIFRTLGTPTEASWPGWQQLPFAKKMKFKVSPATLASIIPPYSHTGPYLSDCGRCSFHLQKHSLSHFSLSEICCLHCCVWILPNE